MKKIRILAVLLVITMAGSGCSPAKPYKETQFLMDTVIEITAYGPNAGEAVKDAFAEFKRIQKLSDKFDPSSQVSQINRLAGMGKMAVDPDVALMIDRSAKMSQLSAGKFDITIGALTGLWGVGQKGEYIPAKQDISQVLPLVDYRQIEVDSANNNVSLSKPGMALDLGGIAKRYAIEKALEKLHSHSIRSALINAGGDISVIGNKPDGTPWRIGLQHPRKEEGLLARITLDKWNTVETSGDYQRYFIKEGVRYAHILDPHTGIQPSEIASVTVISKDNSADIRSSAVFVLGINKGLELLAQFPGTEAIIVATDGRIIVTPGLSNSVEIEK
jgi:thiamine biosynthesis lipoprotein